MMDRTRYLLALLTERFRETMFRTAYAELRHYEDAQDAVAEAILRACRSLPRLRNTAHLRPWLQAITRNEARRIRARNHSARAWETTEDDAQSDTRRTLAQAELRLEVRRAIATLPADQAEAMRLFYWEGRKVSEIAEALARPAGTIKWMLARGRAQLGEQLKELIPMQNPVTAQALILASSINALPHAMLDNAIKRAGWQSVTVPPDPIPILAPGELLEDFLAGPPRPRLVVLAEHIGAISAFELLPLLVSKRRKTDFVIFLLLDGGRTATEMDIAAMSAYLSGVDLLLTQPTTGAEVERFARRALQTLPRKPQP